jgi:beta-glucanase (GH16 family)
MGSMKLAAALFVTAQADPPAGHNWVPVPELTDEFEGGSLDTGKWQKGHPYWNGQASGGPSVFSDGNVQFENGELLLRSTVSDPQQQGTWIASACVTSKTKAAKEGYYYETRMKGSNTAMTASFWLQTPNGWEIDVQEGMGAPSNPQESTYPHKMHINTHDFRDGWDHDHDDPFVYMMDKSSSEDYHIYGVSWGQDTLEYYHNNELVHTSSKSSSDFNEDMYLFFDTEAWEWMGFPSKEELDDNDRNALRVSWVRTWKLAGEVQV